MVIKTNIDGLMNLLVITAVKKRFIFFSDSYKIFVLYTPHKERIYKITNPDKYKFPFEKGDDIEDVIDWCNKHKYEYRLRKKKKIL